MAKFKAGDRVRLVYSKRGNDHVVNTLGTVMGRAIYVMGTAYKVSWDVAPYWDAANKIYWEAMEDQLVAAEISSAKDIDALYT